MHRQLKKLLEKAVGRSEFVIAINLDIRGFSAFSQKVESTDAAVFIKKVYLKLVEDYFSDISYFKLTGDGLLMIRPYTEENLEEIASDTIETCLKAVKDFGSLCVNDPMVNFEVPSKIGIGLSRGSAYCLISGTKILDYSGRVLNLASRLMDFARPRGVVFDESFNIELIPSHLVKLFAQDNIYIKGIAERESIGIYYTKTYTKIIPLSKHPIREIKWNSVTDRMTLKRIKEFSPKFLINLPTIPIDPDQIKFKITHSGIISGRKRKDMIITFDFASFEYVLDADVPQVRVEFDTLVKRLEVNGVKDNWEVNIEVKYPEVWG